jgi:hypothetical protein
VSECQQQKNFFGEQARACEPSLMLINKEKIILAPEKRSALTLMGY